MIWNRVITAFAAGVLALQLGDAGSPDAQYLFSRAYPQIEDPRFTVVRSVSEKRTAALEEIAQHFSMPSQIAHDDFEKYAGLAECWGELPIQTPQGVLQKSMLGLKSVQVLLVPGKDELFFVGPYHGFMKYTEKAIQVCVKETGEDTDCRRGEILAFSEPCDVALGRLSGTNTAGLKQVSFSGHASVGETLYITPSATVPGVFPFVTTTVRFLNGYYLMTADAQIREGYSGSPAFLGNGNIAGVVINSVQPPNARTAAVLMQPECIRQLIGFYISAQKK